jgi:hypothetical protein
MYGIDKTLKARPAKAKRLHPDFIPVFKKKSWFPKLISVVAITLISAGALVNSAIMAPVAMAQDTVIASDSNTVESSAEVDSSAEVFDDDLEDRTFFTEEPTEVTSDDSAGEAGPENAPDDFDYTENAFPDLAGMESDAFAPYQLYIPAVQGAAQADAQSAAVDGVRTYYVDCSQGKDSHDGLSKDSAWKSIRQANKADLKPGDSLLFKRGCSWKGTLVANWHGTSTQRILIGVYGTGSLPKIQDGYTSDVRITGSFQIIQGIHATLSTPPDPDPKCNNQPRGWKAGFAFGPGSSYNIVRASQATRLTIGVYFDPGSDHNKLWNSNITDNNVLAEMTKHSGHGATGVSLHGNYNEVARNYFANNRALCSFDGVLESISIELYTASNSNIHHNTVYNDRVFIEMGSSKNWISENNTVAYNLQSTDYASSKLGARFLVTRGYGHKFGPILETKMFNNVVYLTGKKSKGVTCEKCGTNILTARNNIIWANDEPFSCDKVFVESNNIYWGNSGHINLHWYGFSKNPSSFIADPQFVNPDKKDFRVKNSSPALHRGSKVPLLDGYKWDLAHNIIPDSATVDIGVFEVE